MIIGLPVKDDSENPEIDDRFGRGKMFCIVTESGDFKIVKNTGKEQSSGAGGEAVRTLANEDIDTVIAPHVGPKAMDAFKALGGIKIYDRGEAKTVKDALKFLKEGKLKEVETENSGLKRV
ncbi:MAG: hypothetical protein B6229_04220 [Spirochaetaceae bacterium 4572_7]|nr:MAG: hypothetical protein B6229_04220 [Spirochaetaceae bacterium 4572_7]